MHLLFLSVDYQLSEQHLRPYFTELGAVTGLYLPKRTSGRNKGYAYVTYATERALLSALQRPEHVVNRKVVQVMIFWTPAVLSDPSLLQTYASPRLHKLLLQLYRHAHQQVPIPGVFRECSCKPHT